MASQEPGEVNEPPPRRILFPSTAITHAKSTNQERKQHRDSRYKPTGWVSLGVTALFEGKKLNNDWNLL